MCLFEVGWRFEKGMRGDLGFDKLLGGEGVVGDRFLELGDVCVGILFGVS